MIDCSIVVPAYYPGKVIDKMINSFPIVKEILILDNSSDKILKNNILSNYKHIKYYDLGDIGLGRTFNKSLDISQSNNIFITQPDVELKKNTIENLINAITKYPDAAILAPLVYENNKYSFYDCYDLKLDQNNKIVNKPKSKNNFDKIPNQDFYAEAINSTALLVRKNILKRIGGWDNYYYTYLEDIDLSYNVRKNGYKIVKIANSRVDHLGFGSHDKKMHKEINQKRIFNFNKSSLYFNLKNRDKKYFLLKTSMNFFKAIIKLIINLILLDKQKIIKNIIILKSYYCFFIIEKFYKKILSK